MALRSKTIIKWPKQVTTSLVEQLIKAERNIDKALIVFDSASAEYTNGFRHDHNTYSLIISKLLSANQFKTAEEFLDRMKNENCEVTEEILLSIIRAYGRVHKPHDTIRMFQKMKEFECKPSLKAHVTVFSILVDENQLKVALRFYRYMKQIGFPPSIASLNVLIKALSKNLGTIDSAIRIFREMPSHGCVPDTYTYGTLINGLCKIGKINEAKELLNEMERKDCSPSIITYTNLVNGLCKSNNVDEAIGLLQEMEIKNINPNVYTYSSLMDGLCKNGRSSEAVKFLDIMIEKHHKPNMVTYSTLLHGLCKGKKIREALKIFDMMKLQGLKPDCGLYWKIIEMFCDERKFEKAANFLDEMVLDGIHVNRLSYCVHVKIHNIVVRGLCNGVDLKRAFSVYLSMRARGISVNVETFEALVSIFGRKRDFYKMGQVFDDMVVDGCVPGEDTWKDLVFGVLGKEDAREDVELMKGVYR